MASKRPFLERAIGAISPGWALKREASINRAEAFRQARQIRMQYDGATVGRRSFGWRATLTDANDQGNVGARARLRGVARDMVRNNSHAARAVSVIANNVVGPGIIPTLAGVNDRQKKAINTLIADHMETTAVDADGKHDIYGLQALVMRTVVESGECLVRWRPRLRSDGYPLPFQLQVIEPDYLDTSITGVQSAAAGFGGAQPGIAGAPPGSIAVQGVCFSPFGKIIGYFLFNQHPGSAVFYGGSRIASRFVPVEEVAHVYRVDRPGQVRGFSWFAPVMLNARDLADFMDAHLMRAKIAACFAAFIKTQDGFEVDPNPDLPPADPNRPPLESLEPGMIEYLKAGEEVTFGTPPQALDFDPYIKANLRNIAAGLGVSYEALSGDLSGVNFSSGRMGWIEFQRTIDAWRNFMLIPQFMQRVSGWFLDAATIEVGNLTAARIKWTPPRREMISPDREVPAINKAIRAGITSRDEEVRKLGWDPEELDAEIAAANERADSLHLVFDSDPRAVSELGRAQPSASVVASPSDQPPDETVPEAPGTGPESPTPQPTPGATPAPAKAPAKTTKPKK